MRAKVDKILGHQFDDAGSSIYEYGFFVEQDPLQATHYGMKLAPDDYGYLIPGDISGVAVHEIRADANGVGIFMVAGAQIPDINKISFTLSGTEYILTWNNNHYQLIGIELRDLIIGAVDTVIYPEIKPVKEVPSQITDFNATDDELRQITLTWSNATGDPAPTYDVYRNGVRIAIGQTSPYVDTADDVYVVKDYHVIAINAWGITQSNSDSGMSVGTVPSAIIDFNATDDELNQVTCTWTSATGYPEPTYTLYANGVSIDTEAVSPHVDSFNGTRDYHVVAVNSAGDTTSNVDSGTGLGSVPSYISDFNASDDGVTDITCTWSDATGYPTPTYDIYQDDVLLEADVSSPYVHNIAGEHTYYIIANNSEGSTQSNSDAGSTTGTPPLTNVTFLASDDQELQVTCTWSPTVGNPEPTYDLYTGDTLIQENVTSPHIDDYHGTRNYRALSKNVLGAQFTNTNSGTGLGVKPSAIADFNATDDQLQQVTCTWSDSTGTPTPTHDLYSGTTLIKEQATSPYVDDYMGTRNYHIQANNSAGSTDSNIDSGTGTGEVPSYITDFNASDDEVAQITCTWSDATGFPIPTYDLYWKEELAPTGELVAENVTSPYVDDYHGTRIYYVLAKNSISDRASNTDSGTGIGMAPGVITDFSATDDEPQQVTCTWSVTNGYPIPTYNIFAGTTLLQENATSPYVDSFVGTRDYNVMAINSLGATPSNVDSGTGTDVANDEPPRYELTEALLINPVTYNGEIVTYNGEPVTHQGA